MTKQTGKDLLAEYVFYSKYSTKKLDGSFETWNEVIDRIYDTHRIKLTQLGKLTPQIDKILKEGARLEKAKKILSSQRGRQFAFPDENSGILKHNSKIYNCTGTLLDRLEAFSEATYLLLSGCGVGYNISAKHVSKLPVLETLTGDKVVYQVPDSIEGWAESIHALLEMEFSGVDVEFDYTLIRPEGSLIDGKFMAPGPDSLEKAHNKIKSILNSARGRQLTPFEAHRVMCSCAECVVSGGVRRSAMIVLFDRDDETMLKCKTGNWWETYPELAMANNSVLTTEDDPFSYSEFAGLVDSIKQFGEPGFVRLNNCHDNNGQKHKGEDLCVNPCGEILLRPTVSVNGQKQTGFAFCNLCEINAENLESASDFYHRCKVASQIATIQALYTDFKFMSEATRLIAERDRAIGVSITGCLMRPDVLTNDTLRRGAKMVKEANEDMAALLDINSSLACTTIKPSGNASSILGVLGSGIHPAHAPQYLRRVRVSKTSPVWKTLWEAKSPLVKLIPNEENANVGFITFPVEVDPELQDSVPYKDTMNAVEHLKEIARFKHFWNNKGAADWADANNVSATVEVASDFWSQVVACLTLDNHLYQGVTFLSKFDACDFASLPFEKLDTPAQFREFNEIKRWLESNNIDFKSLLRGEPLHQAGEFVGFSCSGGKCETI